MEIYPDAHGIILQAAKQEFLAHGFEDSSLEQIARRAGISAEQLQSQFPEKIDLFRAIVEKPAQELKENLRKNQDTYFDLFLTYRTDESQKLYQKFFVNFIDYVYDYFDAFKLIIYRSEGTPYEDYIYEIIRMDAARSEEYFAELRRSGKLLKDISHDLQHMISSAYFTGAFETIAHDMTREQAVKYVGELATFFFKGWEAMLHTSRRG